MRGADFFAGAAFRPAVAFVAVPFAAADFLAGAEAFFAAFAATSVGTFFAVFCAVFCAGAAGFPAGALPVGAFRAGARFRVSSRVTPASSSPSAPPDRALRAALTLFSSCLLYAS
ncbi:hypothetical protein [Streptomyces clavuligerus]|uniref:hypothetical protein n=1 Tax=Streptomyces clavuligerus TaxID=1901 RepID=UPI0018CFFF6D|nr:hypothetical protein [Streptomyces clavuligerus]